MGKRKANSGSFNNISKEELARRQAGRHEAQRKAMAHRKQLREYLEIALTMPSETGEGTMFDDITDALIKKAKEGNIRAYEIIRDTMGQKFPERFEVSSNDIEIKIDDKTKPEQ